MASRYISCKELRTRLLLYKDKGFDYTTRKISKEFKVAVILLDVPSSESYSTEGTIYLGTIMDVPYEAVLYHELQHIGDFDESNEDAEYKIRPW